MSAEGLLDSSTLVHRFLSSSVKLDEWFPLPVCRNALRAVNSSHESSLQSATLRLIRGPTSTQLGKNEESFEPQEMSRATSQAQGCP